MNKPKRGRPRKPPEPSEQRSHVARFLEELIRTEGTQEKLVAKIGGDISRPLITQILNGKVVATTAAVAALCRACTTEQATQLLSAHLEDELVRVLTAYRSAPELSWNGQRPESLTISAPKFTPGATQLPRRFVVDPDNMSCFKIKELGQP